MPSVISEEQKQTFLALLRAGRTPTEAAQTIDPAYTGSMFRRLTNESSSEYDIQFAADYLRARAEQRERQPKSTPKAQPRTTTLGGHVKAAYITEEMIEGFLEDVSNGVPLAEACARIEPRTSLSQLNRRATREPAFAEAYAKAKEQGYPLFQEKLRAEAVRQAFNGDYRALRDQLLIHVPEFKTLLTTRHEIGGIDGGQIKLLAERALPDLPSEILDQLIEHVEQKQIEAA